MIVQNNSTPWVILIIFTAALLVIATFIISNNEVFNPIQASQEAMTNATFGAIAAESTQMVLRPTRIAFEATQAAQVQIAEATAFPMRLTATQVAGEAALAELSRGATATTIVMQSTAQAQDLADQYTQTAQDAKHIEFDQTVKLILIIGILTIILGICGGAAYGLIANARVRLYNAQAKLITETRHTMEVEGAIQTKKIQLGIDQQIAQNAGRYSQTRKGGEADYSNLPLAK